MDRELENQAGFVKESDFVALRTNFFLKSVVLVISKISFHV